MTVRFLELARGIEEQRRELDAELGRVVSDARFVLGGAVRRFEEEFASYCGAAHAIGVASGTDAIALALGAVGVAVGDEVVTAANTCVPTVAGIESAGAVPVLADVDPQTRTIAPASIERVLTPRTRAILPVHLYGQCADMSPVLALARLRGLKVVEDAAHAHGATYRGRHAGILGDAAAFSFYPTKNLGAFGDAGAVVTKHDDVADRVRLLRTYGERAPEGSVVVGRNSRLDELQAAVLSVRLRRLDAWNARRRCLAARYDAALGDTDLTLPIEASERTHVYHLYVIQSPRRDAVRATLAAAGIETFVHYPRPVHAHGAYARLGRKTSLDESERLCAEVVSLPLYPQLTDAEVDRVVRMVRAAAEAKHLS